MGERTETERTKISLRGQDTYDISDHLYGIFLEDIGFSVDGGLNANMVNNYSFDGVYLDRQEIRAVEEPLRYWRFEGERMTSGTEKALSKKQQIRADSGQGEGIPDQLRLQRTAEGMGDSLHVHKGRPDVHILRPCEKPYL